MSDAPRSSAESLVAFGNPDGTLAGSQEEVRSLGAIVRESEVLIGEKASKERLQNLPIGISNLHLATHGVLDIRRPRPATWCWRAASTAA